MAIITKPTIVKGQANEIDLSKSDLAAVSKVVNDSYFSDQTNWSKVIVVYKSAEGNQHEMLIFDATGDSPKGNFEVSEKARDSWEVQSVKIMDFDGGYLKLGRGDLTVEEFDIALGSVGGETPVGPISASIFDLARTASNITLTNSSLDAQVTSAILRRSMSFLNTDIATSGKHYFEFDILDVSSGFVIGCVGGDFGIRSISGGATVFSISGGALKDFYIQSDTGNVIADGSPVDAIPLLSVNDKATFAIDLDNNKAWVAINGVWVDGNPSTNTGGYATDLATKVGIYIGVDFATNTTGAKVSFVKNPSLIVSGFNYIGA